MRKGDVQPRASRGKANGDPLVTVEHLRTEEAFDAAMEKMFAGKLGEALERDHWQWDIEASGARVGEQHYEVGCGMERAGFELVGGGRFPGEVEVEFWMRGTELVVLRYELEDDG